MKAFESLMAFQRETEALGQVMGRLGWDQETVMPMGAVRAAAIRCVSTAESLEIVASCSGRPAKLAISAGSDW